jgi:hypothetical protein
MLVQQAIVMKPKEMLCIELELDRTLVIVHEREERKPISTIVVEL